MAHVRIVGWKAANENCDTHEGRPFGTKTINAIVSSSGFKR